MLNKNISLKDQGHSNNLDVYTYNSGICISVFEFECELSAEDTKKLRDFLNDSLKKGKKNDKL